MSSEASRAVDPFIAYVTEQWELSDTNGDGSLDRKEIERVLLRVNLKVKKKILNQKFDEVDVDNSNELNFTEFLAFLQNLRDRPEINEVFVRVSEGNDTITAAQLLNFLTTQQKENVTLADCKRIIEELEVNQDDASNPVMYLNSFAAYMTSDRNDIFDPVEEVVHQDMTRPLAQYWIASSHNTYCTGDQLKGESSVDAYIFALRLGCRCVELDCWDGPDNDPIIYHGHTLTTRIRFRDVVQTIRDNAFIASSYPVILSLENHCSKPQQKVMADIMNEIFGDMLPAPFTDTTALPSPEALQYKILLKGKMFKEAAEAEDVDSSSEEDNAEPAAEPSGSASASGASAPAIATSGTAEPASPALARTWSINVGSLFGRKGADKSKTLPARRKEDKRAISELAPMASPRGRVPSSSNLPVMEKERKDEVEAKPGEELGRMIHLGAVHFRGFTESKAKGKAWEMSSFSENKLLSLVAKDRNNMKEYNSQFLSRIYPKGTRFDSSNYDPMPAWAAGSQLVALNYQTSDRCMWLNQGFFRANGQCGYILKPASLLDPTYKEPTAPVKILTVEVVSAWQLPKLGDIGDDGQGGEVIDPYVTLHFSGAPQDEKRVKTKVIQNNGYNPVWKERFQFSVTNTALGQLVVRVVDSEVVTQDITIGYNCISFNCLRSGYRQVPLYDLKHQRMEGTSVFLFVKIEDPISI